MNERNKQNRDAVRQMTSGQTPAEVEAQKSLTTANPDWITSDDKKSPRQQAHDSRRGVKQARESLSDKVLLRIEENEFLNYLHEQGINVEQLTEEELDELFGFGMNRRSSRDAVKDSREASKSRRDKRETRQKAQDSRQRRKQAMKDRVSKFTANRKAAKLKPEAETQATPKATAQDTSFNSARASAFNPRTGQGGSNMAKPSKHASRLKDTQDKAKEKAARRGYNPNQSKEESTEIIRNSRMALAEKVLSELSKETLQSYKDKITPDIARMRGDKGLKKANTKLTKIAQGKNTPRSVFGGKSNQTSTTAGGGTLGQELAKTKPESQHSMNRRGSSTVDKKKVAANLANARSGRNAASLKKEIDADTEKRRAAKRAEG
tara:strand:- start:1210 stop:2343 length:1134 start_codon:yes stop_codon:yes gene_type:complete